MLPSLSAMTIQNIKPTDPMKSIIATASEKELSILREHYQVPELELTTPATVNHGTASAEYTTESGWRITLYDAVEPLAEAPGTWTSEA